MTTRVDRDSVSATTLVGASPDEVFEFLRRPANHPVISGDHSVTAMTAGPERLALGDRFGMRMRLVLPYVAGYPRRHEKNVATSVANVRGCFTLDSPQ